MASVTAATRTQLETLAASVQKAAVYIQYLEQGTLSGPSVNPAQATLIDAQLLALKNAVVAITG